MRFLITLAILPGLFLIVYIYNLDKKEKEPVGLLLQLTALGALTVISALILEIIGGHILPMFLTPETDLYAFVECFFVVAMAEEWGKYFVMKKVAWKNKNFNYMFDGIIYGVCVGLGFAIVENISYVLQNGVSNALIRAVTAIPGHATFGIYMGWYMSCAKYWQAHGNENKSKRFLMKSFIIPVILHGFYDFCLMAKTELYIFVFYIFIIILYYRTFKMVKKLSASDKPIGETEMNQNEQYYSDSSYENRNNPSDRDYFDGL